jgi:hypothetical protein
MVHEKKAAEIKEPEAHARLIPSKVQNSYKKEVCYTLI